MLHQLSSTMIRPEYWAWKRRLKQRGGKGRCFGECVPGLTSCDGVTKIQSIFMSQLSSNDIETEYQLLMILMEIGLKGGNDSNIKL